MKILSRVAVQPEGSGSGTHSGSISEHTGPALDPLEHSNPAYIEDFRLYLFKKILRISFGRDGSSISNLSSPNIAPLPDVQKPRHHKGEKAHGSKNRQVKRREALQKSSKIG
jgi:hypothetical protein